MSGFVALILFSLPFLLAADDPLAASREANRRRIAEMTAVERQRLGENFQNFQSLPPEQQNRLRELQAATQSDPDLQKTFAAYQQWVETLSPSQRYELRQAKDAEARLRLIDEFRHPTGAPAYPPRPGEVGSPGTELEFAL